MKKTVVTPISQYVCPANMDHRHTCDNDKFVFRCNACHWPDEKTYTSDVDVYYPRPSWDSVWMDVVNSISERSCDDKLKVAAIIVSDDNSQLMSLGYNGNYKNGPNERESNKPGESGFIHAEVNALIKLDFNSHKKKNMYITHSPCRECCKLIVNAEISKVIYGEQYRDKSGLKILEECGIEVVHHDPSITKTSK